MADQIKFNQRPSFSTDQFLLLIRMMTILLTKGGLKAKRLAQLASCGQTTARKIAEKATEVGIFSCNRGSYGHYYSLNKTNKTKREKLYYYYARGHAWVE